MPAVRKGMTSVEDDLPSTLGCLSRGGLFCCGDGGPSLLGYSPAFLHYGQHDQEVAYHSSNLR
jgi:hypothetical protein